MRLESSRELRRANAILKTASAFCRGARPPIATLVKFIDEHRHDMIDGRAFGVEPICRVLPEHGCPIAPSTYYAAKARPTSERVIRDAELLARIRQVHPALLLWSQTRSGFRSAGTAKT